MNIAVTDHIIERARKRMPTFLNDWTEEQIKTWLTGLMVKYLPPVKNGGAITVDGIKFQYRYLAETDTYVMTTCWRV